MTTTVTSSPSAVERVKAFLGSCALDHTARFEQDAEAFYCETGLMAPGKDVPLEMAAGHDDARRRDAWEAWTRARRLAVLAGLHALVAQVATLTRARDDERQRTDDAYTERHQLVAALSTIWPSHWCWHPEDDADWDPEWRWIVGVRSRPTMTDRAVGRTLRHRSDERSSDMAEACKRCGEPSESPSVCSECRHPVAWHGQHGCYAIQSSGPCACKCVGALSSTGGAESSDHKSASRCSISRVTHGPRATHGVGT